MPRSEGNTPSLGDESWRWSSVELLYREHADWLRQLLTRRLPAQPTEVDDLVQETWLRAARPGGGDIIHPKAFLSQTALNLFRDRQRREKVRDAHGRAVRAAPAAGFASGGLSEQEATLELERIVLDLPEKLRDVFVLSRFRHMSNREIADHLGIAIKTVEWRMGKALELCMRKVRD